MQRIICVLQKDYYGISENYKLEWLDSKKEFSQKYIGESQGRNDEGLIGRRMERMGQGQRNKQNENLYIWFGKLYYFNYEERVNKCG